ncbi:MAG: hypothetical protein HZA81_00330 [Candidatus Taylorbacteria bacterium]|nr:hypothetical protein [Candidatus Taylorbacteria bacterium]
MNLKKRFESLKGKLVSVSYGKGDYVEARVNEIGDDHVVIGRRIVTFTSIESVVDISPENQPSFWTWLRRMFA